MRRAAFVLGLWLFSCSSQPLFATSEDESTSGQPTVETSQPNNAPSTWPPRSSERSLSDYRTLLEKLKPLVARLTQQVNELTRRLQTLQTELETLQTQRDRLTASSASLRQQAAAAVEQLEAVTEAHREEVRLLRWRWAGVALVTGVVGAVAGLLLG